MAAKQKRRVYTDQDKEHAIAVYATTGNLSKTARQTGVPLSTLRGWMAEQPAEEVQQARLDARAKFVEAAWVSIAKGLETGNIVMSFILENRGRIDQAIKSVFASNLTKENQTALVKALAKLSDFDLREVSTYIGTIYDKIALATGQPTGISRLEGEVKDSHEYKITQQIIAQNPRLLDTVFAQDKRFDVEGGSS